MNKANLLYHKVSNNHIYNSSILVLSFVKKAAIIVPFLAALAVLAYSVVASIRAAGISNSFTLMLLFIGVTFVKNFVRSKHNKFLLLQMNIASMLLSIAIVVFNLSNVLVGHVPALASLTWIESLVYIVKISTLSEFSTYIGLFVLILAFLVSINSLVNFIYYYLEKRRIFAIGTLDSVSSIELLDSSKVKQVQIVKPAIESAQVTNVGIDIDRILLEQRKTTNAVLALMEMLKTQQKTIIAPQPIPVVNITPPIAVPAVKVAPPKTEEKVATPSKMQLAIEHLKKNPSDIALTGRELEVNRLPQGVKISHKSWNDAKNTFK